MVGDVVGMGGVFWSIIDESARVWKAQKNPRTAGFFALKFFNCSLKASQIQNWII